MAADADAPLIVLLAFTAVVLGFVLHMNVIMDPIATFLAWVALGLCSSIAVELFIRTLP